VFELVCDRCGARHDASHYRLHCDRCGGLLDIEYDVAPTVEFRVLKDFGGLRRYAPMLPIGNAARLVSLGEGDTPVVSLPAVGAALGLGRLSAKLECCNPTGAFKDRGSAVEVTVLRELGIEAVADIAGGNTGVSLACYCARAGIRFIGFAYEDPRHPQLQAIAGTGAEMHRIEGNREACAAAIADFCRDTGVLNLRYSRNAYFIEGQKTFAYEILEQLDALPDHVVVPVGNGSLLLGSWRGFRELLQDGRAATMPRLHAAQSAAFQPLVAALHGTHWRAEPRADTLAVGLRASEPPRLDALVSACRESGGQAVAVSDNAVAHWQRRLAELEGLLVEPTAAAPLAAAEILARRGDIGSDEHVLVALTGSYKQPTSPRS